MSIRRMMLFTLGGFFKSIISLFKTRVLNDGGTFEAETNLENQLNNLGSTLFDSASLVITPNGVKTSKLYSIKPNDGTGDLDVVRNTSATRVNEQGLVEIPVTNLILRSEEFNNVAWLKNGISVTENSIISPNGTITSDKITADGTIAIHTLWNSALITNGATYTYTIYAKKGTNDFLQLYWGVVLFGDKAWANFNLDTGVVGSVGSNATASIQSIGNGWYRLITTATAIASGTQQIVASTLITSNTSPRAETNTLSTSVYLWGAQLEQGVTATEYIPTTSVIRTRFAGITQDGGSASNIPRIDYTTGSPAILVEPQRTNLVYPSDIATTQVIAVTAQVYTLSFYGTGTVTLSGVFSGSLVGTGTNNRVSLTFTPTAGNLTLTVSGSVTNWQLEAGSNATSLIKTTTGSVTRNADVISKSGISNLIGQTSGSIYIEFYQSTKVDGLKSLLQLFTNTLTDTISIQTPNNSNTRLGIEIIASSITNTLSINTPSQFNKLCVVYSTSGSKVFLNGVLVGTIANSSLPAMASIQFGNRNTVRQWESGINKLTLWNNQLSDQQAITLTTL